MDRTETEQIPGREEELGDATPYSTWFNGHTPKRIRGVHNEPTCAPAAAHLALDRPSSFVVHLWLVRS